MLCMQLTRKERKKGLFSLLRPLKPTNYKQIEGLSFCVLLFLIWLLSFTAKKSPSLYSKGNSHVVFLKVYLKGTRF